ncbi:hypothetical protein RFI_34879, partial [Reticulomyxa filosa]
KLDNSILEISTKYRYYIPKLSVYVYYFQYSGSKAIAFSKKDIIFYHLLSKKNQDYKDLLSLQKKFVTPKKMQRVNHVNNIQFQYSLLNISKLKQKEKHKFTPIQKLQKLFLNIKLHNLRYLSLHLTDKISIKCFTQFEKKRNDIQVVETKRGNTELQRRDSILESLHIMLQNSQQNEVVVKEHQVVIEELNGRINDLPKLKHIIENKACKVQIHFQILFNYFQMI